MSWSDNRNSPYPNAAHPDALTFAVMKVEAMCERVDFIYLNGYCREYLVLFSSVVINLVFVAYRGYENGCERLSLHLRLRAQA